MRERGEKPHWRWLGGKRAEVRIAGHSHMICLHHSMALLSRDEQSRVAVFDDPDHPNHETSQYWSALSNDARATGIVWGGNEHAVVFLLSADPIAVIGPRQEAPPDGSPKLIPYTMVKALWEIWLAPLAAFLRGYPHPGGLLIIGTPPPKPEELVREGIAVEPYFVGLLEQHDLTPATAPVVATPTRVACWDALQDVLEETAATAGASFLPVPADTTLPDGTLRPEYCGPDATHANERYGLRMWQHILTHTSDGGR